MFEDIFVQLVAILAIIYALIVFFIQNQLINRKEIESIQAESKAVSEELNAAQKSGNKARIDEALKKQMDMLPKMNKMMFGQLKVMGVVLVVFFLFTALVANINPFTKDDIRIPMKDDGLNCDQKANDGIFSACFRIGPSNFSSWTYAASVIKDGKEVGHNTTEFSIGMNQIHDTLIENPYDEKPPQVWTDKKEYSAGENAKLYAIPQEQPTEVNAILDNGTRFGADLPITIPIFNTKRIHQPQWWFILVSVIANLCISTAFGKFKAQPAQNAPKPVKEKVK